MIGTRLWIPASVAHIAPETDALKTFRLELPKDAAFSFLPGQFVLLRLPDDESLARAFSIASSPLKPDSIEITVQAVEKFSRRLFSLSGGETVFISEAQGRWIFQDSDRHAAFVTSGPGLSSVRSMILYALEKGLPNTLDLFYEAPSPDSIPYERELSEFARNGVGVHLAITDPKSLSASTGAPWDGAVGAWSAASIRSALRHFNKTAFYLCGSGRLIDRLSPELLKLGISQDSLRVERWGDY